ncbi:MAG: PDZ domain-containing protein [Acetivibrio sp.]
MSNEEKKELQMNDEKRAFIREQIAPKRRNAFKRFMGSAVRTSCLAILFGLVGSFVFSVLTPYFDTIFEKKEGDTVAFAEPTKSPSPTPVTPSPTPEVKKKEKEEKLPVVTDIESYEQLHREIKEIADTFNHSVVKVSGVQSGVDWFNNPTESKEATSGIIIADSNKHLYILTGLDKITEVTHIQVTFENEETLEGTLQGKDKDTNIAVISVPYENISKELRQKIKVAVLGDSYYAQAGTPVLALGSPNGYMYSMDVGIISGNPIEEYITDRVIDVFCTDMNHIEDGNGVIVDLNGSIVGIITHRFEKDRKVAQCMAIGISGLKNTIEKMIQKTGRAYFGVTATNIPEEYRENLGASRGIYVTEVVNNSPALKAGIQVGDIITDMNSSEITSVAGFSGTLSVFEPKTSIKVKLLRTSQTENKEKTVSLIIGEK